MKHLYLLFIFLIQVTLSVAHAQRLQGTATYGSQQKMEIKLDSSRYSKTMQDQIKAMLKKQSEKEYTLHFTDQKSEYKEVPQLDNPNTLEGGGMKFVVAASDGSDILYKDMETLSYLNKVEFFGKQFLIRDSLSYPKWELEKETKNIGEYTCFKATFRQTYIEQHVVSGSESAGDKNSVVKKEKERLVTAWYTPQIPVSNGPGLYGGLPGLILELNDGNQTILCSRIVLNSKDAEKITEPNGGKMVSQEAYDAIVEKKMEEMKEQYKSGRKGEGHNLEIRIGG